MALSENFVSIIGNLGATPELRSTTSGTPVTNLSVATNRTYRTQDGKSESETTWHKVTVFGKTAQNCAQYLVKGDQVHVKGRLSNRKYTDKKTGMEHTVTEIVADHVQFGNKADRGEEIQEAPVTA